MSDLSKTLERYRLPLKRDSLKQAGDYAAPAMRFAARNPLLLIGAGVLAIMGIVAFTNRKKIAAKAAPMIEDAKAKAGPMIDEAKAKGQALMGDAAAKGQELLATAKTRGKAIAEKISSRSSDTPPNGVLPTEVH
jgi:hypothetical protein